MTLTRSSVARRCGRCVPAARRASSPRAWRLTADAANRRHQDARDRHERDDRVTSDELGRLRRENARLQQERDLLKRATAFFAAETKTGNRLYSSGRLHGR